MHGLLVERFDSITVPLFRTNSWEHDLREHRTQIAQMQDRRTPQVKEQFFKTLEHKTSSSTNLPSSHHDPACRGTETQTAVSVLCENHEAGEPRFVVRCRFDILWL